MSGLLERFRAKTAFGRSPTPAPPATSRQQAAARRAITPAPQRAISSFHSFSLFPRDSEFAPGSALNPTRQQIWDRVRPVMAQEGIYIPHADFWENWPPTSAESPDVLLVKERTQTQVFKDVYLKIVPSASKELKIIKRLTSSDLRPFSQLACPPVLRIFEHSSIPTAALFTMPPLRPAVLQDMTSVGDCLDFLRQSLEGLVFLHSQGIAHLDISLKNIMIVLSWLGMSPTQKHLPAAHPLHYCHIDFGSAAFFEPGEARLHRHGGGIYMTAPEVHEFREHPAGPGYDPFPVDIFLVGYLIRFDFVYEKANMRFLSDLSWGLSSQDPAKRPTAEGARDLLASCILRLKRSDFKKTAVRADSEMLRTPGETPVIAIGI